MASAIAKLRKSIIYGMFRGYGTFSRTRSAFDKHYRVLNLYIAHTEPHVFWADSIRQHLGGHLEGLFPEAQLNFGTIQINPSVCDSLTKLQSHSVLNGSIVEPGHTFVISTGWWESQMVDSARTAGIVKVPQLFCLPSSNATLFDTRIFKNDERRFVGGVHNVPNDPERYVKSLKALRSRGIKRVIIAFNRNDDSEYMSRAVREQVARVRAAFTQARIGVEYHDWSHREMGFMSLYLRLRNADALITMHEPTAEAHRREIGVLAARTKKLWFASNLDALYFGAGAAIGVDSGTFAAPLAGLIRDAIADPSLGFDFQTHCIPAQPAAHVNRPDIRAEQGVILTPDEEELLNMRLVTDDRKINLV